MYALACRNPKALNFTMIAIIHCIIVIIAGSQTLTVIPTLIVKLYSHYDGVMMSLGSHVGGNLSPSAEVVIFES